MLIISFGWTWPAFVARAKSVTRRVWSPLHAKKFRMGTLFQGYDKSARFGGIRIGIGRVTEPVLTHALHTMPDEDYFAEGFAWLNEHPKALLEAARVMIGHVCTWPGFQHWRLSGGSWYVLRFEIEEVEPAAVERLEKMLA